MRARFIEIIRKMIEVNFVVPMKNKIEEKGIKFG